MRIAVTNPTNWPAVRRGTERFINELAAYLAARHHDVTILSAHASATEVSYEGGFRTRMTRRLWRPWMGSAGFLEFHLFFLTSLYQLVEESLRVQPFDVVLNCTFMDSCASILARQLTGTPCVFWVNGLPTQIRYTKALSAKGKFFRFALHHSDESICFSHYMQDRLNSSFGRIPLKLFVPVDLRQFALSLERDLSRPIIFCAAALEDRRKGGRTLMLAFNFVKRRLPTSILQISCHASEQLREQLTALVEPEFRRDVHFLGAGALSDQPTLLGRAAVSVLPSRWEPFGMIINESLAVGTPVAATRDGALPELLSDPNVGRMFDPGAADEPEPKNPELLARAILDCIDLSRDARTPQACRSHAARCSWDLVGPEYEQLLWLVAKQGAAFRRTRHLPVRMAGGAP